MRSRLTNIEGAGAAERPRASVEPVKPMARVGSSAESGVEMERPALAAAANPVSPEASPPNAASPEAGRSAPEQPAAPQFDDDEWEW
jgi:hypothetical protein